MIPESLWEEIKTESFEEERFAIKIIDLDELKKILEKYFEEKTPY